MPPGAFAVLIGVVAGLIFGSFAATLIIRWPAGRSIAHGRSACDSCGSSLGVAALIPLLSWAVQRGQCTRCGARIDPLHPLTELLFAAIGGAALALSPDWQGGALALMGWQVATLALLDARHQWLPHRLSGLLALTGLLFGGWAMSALGLTVPLTDRMIGATVGFGALWLIGTLYQMIRKRQGLGGGDPPFMGALGAWLGWLALPPLLLIASVGGLAMALTMIALDRNRAHMMATQRLPFGTLLALALPFTLLLLMAR